MSGKLSGDHLLVEREREPRFFLTVTLFLELEQEWYPRSFEKERCPPLDSDNGC